MKRTLLLVVVIAGCSADLPLDTSTLIRCDANICPAGLTCVANRCVSPELVDRAGPTLITPEDRNTLRAGEVTFSWGTVPAAIFYTLTVASDPGFTQLVGETPRSITRNTESVTLPAGTYYWRVTSDVTEPAVGAARVVGLVSDSVYVACRAGDDCAANDAIVELGTRELPFRVPSRAVAGAVRFGVSEVRVAARPDDQAYNDAFTMAAGVSVLGGFDAQFTSRTARSVLVNTGTIVNIFDVSAPTRLDGFTLRADPTSQSTVLRMLLVSADVSIEHIRFETPLLRTPLIVLETNVDALGPTFTNCELSAELSDAESLSLDPASPLLRALNGAVFTLSDSSIVGHSISSARHLIGLQLDGASATLRSTTIDLDAESLTTGLIAHGPGEYAYGQVLRLEDVSVNVSSSGNSVGLIAEADQVLDVLRSTIDVSAHDATSSQSTGIVIDVGRSVRIASSVVYAHGAGAALAINGHGIEGALQNNTIAVSATGAVAKLTGRSYPRFANNLFLGNQISTFFTAIEIDNEAQPMALINNATVTLTHVDNSSLPLINTTATAFWEASVSPTDTYPSAEAAGLGPDFRPSSESSLVGKGIAPDAPECLPGNQPYGPTDPIYAYMERIGPQSCGGVTVDRDNKQRPTAPTLGAYEP